MGADRILGIDVGSTTIKVVTIDLEGRLRAHRYVRARGRPRDALLATVQDLGSEVDPRRIAAMGLTGSGGEVVAGLVGGRHRNELVAQTRAVSLLHPEARTVIEIGGQDSKLMILEPDPSSGGVRLVDFSMNALCAAGTGSFLDQQAERLGIDIEDEFARIALRSTSPARVAGRCTVFAKSDMIHLQQRGVPMCDILAGVCLALARNFKTIIGKGKIFRPPVLLQGGVAFNQAVARAFENVLNLAPGEIIVPEHREIMAALGAALLVREDLQRNDIVLFEGFDRLREAASKEPSGKDGPPPLRAPRNGRRRFETRPAWEERGGLAVDIGVDVGSISTKVVVLDDRNRVLAKRYLMTGGRPLEAVKRGLNEIGEEVGGRVIVRSVGSTGSGRHLTGHFIGADVVRNEITAQARAAVAIDPGVDTIFEIGGQDSKYIRVSNGAVVDFAMNSACAAGTGSFLEEQADRLRINVANEFASLAMASAHPVALGERCTVFMESDLVHHQQRGATVQDLTAGLAYSIAHNYLNRVVHGRPIGERILFQGGVAHNASVVAAFESLLDRPVVVPPDHEVSGAIGAAILAREARLKAGPGWAGSRFGGFDLEARTYEASTFECRACPNLCEISKIVVTGERPFFHGARCDKFEEAGRPSSMVDLPDLFAERNSLLEDGGRGSVSNGGRSRVGIPRALLAWELLPFYRTFFEELGFEPVVSDPTTPAITRAALERAGAETCFPVKLLHGHIEDVLSRGVDYVFLPSVVNRERRSPGQPGSQCCPYIPAAGRIAAATLDPRSRGAIPLLVTLELSWANGRRTQLRALAPALGVSERQIVRAVEAGEAEQRAFREVVRRRGRAVLSGLSSDHPAAVIVGRPYNTCDAGACLSVPDKLRRIGVLPIPMEYLDLESVDVSGRYGNMFWTSGQDILAAARIIAAHPHLQAIYITNFGCGPDSFLLGFFGRLMKEKPFLELEIDEHSADAGVETRCEAFFDSLR